MLIYVGGIPGVGKTKTIKETQKLARAENVTMEIIRGAPILCELAGVSTEEKLRALAEETRRELRPEMYRRIYEMDRKDPGTIRIGDGHFVYFDWEGKRYGTREIQPWDKEQLFAIAVIVASCNTILHRRTKEAAARPDRKLDLAFIDREQTMELKIARAQASELSIPFALFCNEGSESPKTSVALFAFILHQALSRKATHHI